MNEIGEAELAHALRDGRVVGGVAKGGRRAVQAGVLRKCLRKIQDRADPAGFRLENAFVAGRLDLTGLVIPFPLRFQGCEFEVAPVLEGAQLFELALRGSPRLPGLLGNGLRVQRDLDLSGSTVTGANRTSASTSKTAAIWLGEAHIGGRLLCAGTVVDGQGSRSIHADRIQVGGAVRFIQGFTSSGEIRLHAARLESSLDLNGAQITSLSGSALDLENADITGSVFLIEDPSGLRPCIHGRVTLASARVGARLLIRNATIEALAVEQQASIYERPTSTGSALNARRLSAGAEVALEGDCQVTGKVDLSMAEMSSVSITGSCALRAPGAVALDLTNATIRAQLLLGEGASVEGVIRLAGAAVRGTLALHGHLGQPERLTLVDGSAMSVEGDALLDGLQASGGGVDLGGATLGSLSARNAQLHNPGACSLRLSQAVVKGPVRLIEGFTSTGLVALNRTTVEGRLHFTGGSFDCPAPAAGNADGHAIEAISATVHGALDLGWKHVSPSVDFTNLTTTSLADDPATWPGRFIISGLAYTRFGTPQGSPLGPVWDPVARRAWLRRQAAFDSGPYEQAARVCRQHGYVREADQLLIAQHRDAREARRRTTPWPRRGLDALYATIGYGYRPARVLWLLAALLILVAASLTLPASRATLRATNGSGDIYTTNGPLITPSAPATPASQSHGSPAYADSCGDGAVRCFSPALYAIDTVVPLISFDQRSTWYPDPGLPGGQLMLWWLNIATMLGWLLSSIFVVSLARLSRNP